jgi:hypothetical protein
MCYSSTCHERLRRAMKMSFKVAGFTSENRVWDLSMTKDWYCSRQFTARLHAVVVSLSWLGFGLCNETEITCSPVKKLLSCGLSSVLTSAEVSYCARRSAVLNSDRNQTVRFASVISFLVGGKQTHILRNTKTLRTGKLSQLPSTAAGK